MGRHSISLVVFCMVFGFLIGIAGFSGMAFLGGFVEIPEAEAVSSESSYATGTERLEAYRCRTGETKQIMIGGIEDSFDLSGEETATPTQGVLDYLEKSGGELTRKYDDPEDNRFFVDQFKLPSRTFHGIITLRLEERSGVKNDGLSMGYGRSGALHRDDMMYWSAVADLPSRWNSENGYVWEELDNIKILDIKEKSQGANEVTGFSGLTILDGIRAGDSRPLTVQIADDTIVDFIGFAVCLEPEIDKGSTASRFHHGGPESTFEFGEGFVNLYTWRQTYTGNTLCTEKRPVACMKDQNLKAPDELSGLKSILWSGGTLKFSEAVTGNRFKTEDQVNEYCRVQFGDGFRTANIKDGAWMGSIVAYGEYPDGEDYFWVTFKDQPHFNCWDLRPDYDDFARLEAQE